MRSNNSIFTTMIIGILLFGCNSPQKDNNASLTNENKFEIIDSLSVTDIDDNIYHAVKIGTQVWMVENLRTTHFNDGTTIPLVLDSARWSNLNTPGYCWYNNDSTKFKNIYGALYNWYAVNTGKLAPKGWHVASDSEWTILKKYLIANGYNYDGSRSNNKIAKSLASTTNWPSSEFLTTGGGSIYENLSKNNSSGFSALPGGCRYVFGFYNVGEEGSWWSSTEKKTFKSLVTSVGTLFGINTNKNNTLVWIRHLSYYSNNLDRWDAVKRNGFSVRCVKDN